MNMKRLAIVFAAALLVLSGLLAGEPVKGFKTESVVLYQPDPVLRERIPSVEELSGYIKRLQSVCETFFADSATPETLYIVVALKPGKQSRVWFISFASPSGEKSRDSLRLKLEAVAPIEVQHGPVAFAISAKIAGGSVDPLQGDRAHQPPIPKQWLEAAKGHKDPLSVPDGYLELVWPDKK